MDRDRQEHMMAANQGRNQHHLARMAFDQDGQILAMADEFWHDQGGYVRTHGANVPNRTVCMLTGAYKIPAFKLNVILGSQIKHLQRLIEAPGRFESTRSRENNGHCRGEIRY